MNNQNQYGNQPYNQIPYVNIFGTDVSSQYYDKLASIRREMWIYNLVWIAHLLFQLVGMLFLSGGETNTIYDNIWVMGLFAFPFVFLFCVIMAVSCKRRISRIMDGR